MTNISRKSLRRLPIHLVNINLAREFTKTIWEYLGSAASDRRIANGKTALNDHRRTLEAIEKRYGVEKEVVVAVWGLESGYGRFTGSNRVIQSLV